jgi:hypothetical protein
LSPRNGGAINSDCTSPRTAVGMQRVGSGGRLGGGLEAVGGSSETQSLVVGGGDIGVVGLQEGVARRSRQRSVSGDGSDIGMIFMPEAAVEREDASVVSSSHAADGGGREGVFREVQPGSEMEQQVYAPMYAPDEMVFKGSQLAHNQSHGLSPHKPGGQNYSQGPGFEHAQQQHHQQQQGHGQRASTPPQHMQTHFPSLAGMQPT